MLLVINDRMTLEEIEDRFEECFPGLRLCFYSRDHKPFEKSDERFRFDPDSLIGDIRTVHNNDVYEIKSWYTVERVESDLKEKYGLNAQVCRYERSGRIVQTASTDTLTLQQQTEISRAAS